MASTIFWILNKLNLDNTIHKVCLKSIIQDEKNRKALTDLLKEEFKLKQELDNFEIPIREVLFELYFVIKKELEHQAIQWNLQIDIKEAKLIENEYEYELTKRSFNLLFKNTMITYKHLASFFVQKWLTVRDVATSISQEYKINIKELCFQSKSELDHFLMKSRRLEILDNHRHYFFLFLENDKIKTKKVFLKDTGRGTLKRREEIVYWNDTFISIYNVWKLIVPRIWR